MVKLNNTIPLWTDIPTIPNNTIFAGKGSFWFPWGWGGLQWFWDWSDGDLVVSSWTTYLTLDQVYNYSSITVASWATLSWTWTGALKLYCQWICDIQGTIDVVGLWWANTSYSDVTLPAVSVNVGTSTWSWWNWWNGWEWYNSSSWVWSWGTWSASWYGWGWGWWEWRLNTWKGWNGWAWWTPWGTGWTGWGWNWWNWGLSAWGWWGWGWVSSWIW